MLIKLCCCNLWSEALTALGISTAYRLPQTSSLPWVKRKLLQKLKEAELPDIIERIDAVNKAVEPLPDDYTNGLEAFEAFKAMQDVDNINDGEQILAAILMRSPDGKTLLSGDKRFIEAFRNAFPKEWETLSKCIISFEMCLEAIEAKYGYDHIHKNAAHIKHCDGTLKLAIQAEPNREHFIECIASYNPCRVVIEVTETLVVVQG